MWTLVSIMPFLVGDLVPEDNENFKCFCILLKISSIATSQEISIDTVEYMHILIEEHHHLFKTMYPCESILPLYSAKSK